MSVDFTKTAATSKASGFGNYAIQPFSASIGAQHLAANAFVTTTATTPLNNTSALSQVQTKYTGLEAFYRVVPGQREVGFPDYNLGVTERYAVGSIVYFTGGNLNVFTYVVDQTGAGTDIPAITIDCRAFLFRAPF